MDKKGIIISGIGVSGIGLASGIIAFVRNKIYDKDGFNKKGYNKDGYNKDGYDKVGYDKDGYDKDGFNREGIDDEGYNREGFKGGFDRDGYDRYGYGKDGYNKEGKDRAGHSQQYYAGLIKKYRNRQDEAYQELKCEDTRHALQDSRTSFEETLRLLVMHKEGNYKNSMDLNLSYCKGHGILQGDFLEKMYGVKRLTNLNIHDFEASETMSHNTVHFVVMQVNDLLDFAESYLVGSIAK